MNSEKTRIAILNDIKKQVHPEQVEAASNRKKALIEFAKLERDRLSNSRFLLFFPLYRSAQKVEAINNAINRITAEDEINVTEAARNKLIEALKIKRHSFFDSIFKRGQNTTAYQSYIDNHNHRG